MNTTFNIHRFWNFLRWDFIQNYRSYITLTLGVFIALIAIYFFDSRMALVSTSYTSYNEDSMSDTVRDSFMAGYDAGRNMGLNGFGMVDDETSNSTTEEDVEAASPSSEPVEVLSQPEEPSMYTEWAEMVMTIVVVLYGARVFKQMRRKEGTIAFLMQPASRLEKFVGRTLTVLVMSLVCCLLAIVLADVVFLLISLAMPSISFSPVIVELFKAIFGMSDSVEHQFAIIRAIGETRLGLFNYVFTAAIFSTYIFGGTIFKRRPMFITSLINCIVGIILIILAVNTLLHNVRAIQESSIGIGEFTTIVTIILAFICVINIYLAYVFFCRKQIIS